MFWIVTKGEVLNDVNWGEKQKCLRNKVEKKGLNKEIKSELRLVLKHILKENFVSEKYWK